MKVYIESYGCTFNKADGQIMAGILNENNIELVDNINDCDVIIVNTCYVKLPTENKIVYKIQQLQKNYPDKKIIVGGCMVEIDPEKCKGCGLCQKNCPVAAIEGEARDKRAIDQEKCIKCGTCLNSCPFKAIG